MWNEKSAPTLVRSFFGFFLLCLFLTAISPDGLASTYHTIQAGDNLWSISRHYKVPLESLMTMNALNKNSILKIGQKILIEKSQEESSKEIITYTICAGDNIWSIAKKYGVPQEKILKDNNLTECSILRIGQKIKITGSQNHQGTTQTAKNQPATTTIQSYEIRKGDSLWTISRVFGVSIKTIMAENNLSENSILQIGMKLKIPTQQNEAPQVLVAQNDKKNQTTGKEGFYYTIASGDTLWNISRKYGVSVNTLLKVNNLKSADRLQINQKIWVSSSEKRPSSGDTSNQYQIYQVQSGDSLWSIARRYRVSLDLLMNVNGLNQQSRLRIGQQIRIPTYVSDGYGESQKGYIWPVRGRVSSPFGMRGGRMHKGIDICAPAGTIIRAAQSGVVTFSGSSGNYGRMVIITHADGHQTVYAHNSVNLVTRGQRVNQSDPIARVGSTGNATGNHCHFEIRQKGTAINPMSQLRK